MWNAFLEQISNTSWVEWIATVTALLYLVLAAYENVWCWAMALISVALYCYLFIQGQLFFESILQVYYFGMALYGWYTWTRNPTDSDSDAVLDGASAGTLKVQVWALRTHLILIPAVLVFTLATGAVVNIMHWGEMPFLDAFTTWFAIVATVMVAHKVLENWLYWIVIDAVSIYLYVNRGFYLTAVLFALYVIMAVLGYFKWRKAYQAAL